MSPEQVVFAVAGAVCIIGAVIAVTHPGPRAAGAGLIVTILSVAVLCAGLAAPAVAGALIGSALLAVVPLVVLRVTAPPSRGDRSGDPAVLGAGLLIAATLVAILFLAIVRGEVPVNVSLRSTDGYDMTALIELISGRAAAAAGGSVALLVAAIVAVRSVTRARRTPR